MAAWDSSQNRRLGRAHSLGEQQMEKGEALTVSEPSCFLPALTAGLTRCPQFQSFLLGYDIFVGVMGWFLSAVEYLIFFGYLRKM